MRLGNGFFLALAVGATWGAVFSVVITILAMLVSGETLVPRVGAASISGLITAGLYIVTAPARRGLPLLVLAAMLFLALLIAISGFEPLGRGLAVAPHYQWPALLLLTSLSVAGCHLCLRGARTDKQRRYTLEVIFIRLMKGLGFVIFTIIVALPFYIMLMTSLKSQQSLLANPLDFSVDFSRGFDVLFRSYIELFTKYDFATFLLNSAVVSVVTVIITLLFSVPGAYAVARLNFPGQAFLSRSILLIYMVPAIVLVIPLYTVFSQLGLRNSLYGLMVVYPATTIPVAVYMLQGYFRGLPYELEEAGLMDGLSRTGVIRKITLPLSLPALASVSLYIFMIAWNEFLFAFMFLDDPAIFTLSRGVHALDSSEIPRQHLMAGAVIATVPVLAVFLWFERYLVAGLTAGSVKG